MNILEAFVICFIACLLYKLMKSSGLPISKVEQLKKDISISFANIAKKYAIEHKKTVVSCHDDLRSGDPVRVDAAIKKIEAIFDKDITDANELLAKYNDKPESSKSNSSNSTNQELKG